MRTSIWLSPMCQTPGRKVARGHRPRRAVATAARGGSVDARNHFDQARPLAVSSRRDGRSAEIATPLHDQREGSNGALLRSCVEPSNLSTETIAPPQLTRAASVCGRPNCAAARCNARGGAVTDAGGFAVHYVAHS